VASDSSRDIVTVAAIDVLRCQGGDWTCYKDSSRDIVTVAAVDVLRCQGGDWTCYKSMGQSLAVYGSSVALVWIHVVGRGGFWYVIGGPR
jgi:hypothetical protein